MPVWAPLAATCLGQFMVVLDATIVNVALPAMRRGLDLSTSDLQWVVNAYLLTLGGLILLGGRLGDHFGRKRVYLIGGLIFSAASLAGGVAPDGGWLLGARAVQGVGAALLAPGTLSLLTSAYTEPRARTRALAVWGISSASGGALGVLLGGALTDVLGWRSVLFVNVPLGVLVLVLGGIALPRSAGAQRHSRLDVPGALSVTAALTALVYGVVGTESHPWGSTHTLVVLATAAALFVTAGVIESRASNALIPFAVLRRGAVATATTMMLIHGAVVTATIYFQSLYLQQVRGFSPFDTGLLMTPLVMVAIATPLFTASLIARHGPRLVAIAALIVEIGGIVWLSFWGTHGAILTSLVLPSMLFNLGGSVCFLSMTVLLTSDMEGQHSGLGSGLFNAGRQVGGSIGLAALTVVAATHTRSLLRGSGGALALADARGYGLALRVGAALLAVGALVIAAHARHRRVRAAAAGDADSRPVEFA